MGEGVVKSQPLESPQNEQKVWRQIFSKSHSLERKGKRSLFLDR